MATTDRVPADDVTPIEIARQLTRHCKAKVTAKTATWV